MANNKKKITAIPELARLTQGEFLETDKKIDTLHQEMKQGFSKVEKEMKEGFSKVESKVRNLDSRMDSIATGIGQVRADIKQLGKELKEDLRVVERLERLEKAVFVES